MCVLVCASKPSGETQQKLNWILFWMVIDMNASRPIPLARRFVANRMFWFRVNAIHKSYKLETMCNVTDWFWQIMFRKCTMCLMYSMCLIYMHIVYVFVCVCMFVHESSRYEWLLHSDWSTHDHCKMIALIFRPTILVFFLLHGHKIPITKFKEVPAISLSYYFCEWKPNIVA